MLVFLAVMSAGLAVGCAGFSYQVFQAERAAAASGDALMKGYARFWSSAITNPAAFHRTKEVLNAERAQAEAASIKLGSSIEMTEALRRAYVTNAAVRPALEASLRSVNESLSNVVETVHRLMR